MQNKVERARFKPEGGATIVVGAQTYMIHHQDDGRQLGRGSARSFFNRERIKRIQYHRFIDKI